MMAINDGKPMLEGIKIVDLTSVVFGPYCTHVLCELGAEVIKVETPGVGDSFRWSGKAAATPGMSPGFMAINRGKQSYTADLKHEGDLAAVKALIARADVLIHNFRPGIMDRLGLGWDQVSALNPRLIYAGVSGYGPDGPWRDRPGQDLLVQSLSGIAWFTTDYMFRSISNTSQNPAVQAELDLTYGIFYAYMWGSNSFYGENLELDYGIGITPKWGPVTFNIAGLAYTWPGANDIDFFELKTGASWTSGACSSADTENPSSRNSPTRSFFRCRRLRCLATHSPLD